MKLISTTSFLALLGLATPTLAFDIGGGFSLTGNLDFERIDSGSDNASFGVLDADLTYEHSSGFGGFIGVQAYSSSSSNAEAIYGALSYSGDFGKIQIGAPRNALDDYITAPAIAGIELLDLQIGLFTGSFVPYYALTSNETPLGLRYDGNFGATSVGASYHSFDGGRVFDLAMNHRMGDTVLKAGIESVSGGGDAYASYFIGAEHDFGQLLAGVNLGKSEVFGSETTSAHAFATYSVNDRLDITATVISVSGAGPDGTLYGLDADFALNEMVHFKAGYMGSDNSGIGSEDVAMLGLSVRF